MECLRVNGGNVVLSLQDAVKDEASAKDTIELEIHRDKEIEPRVRSESSDCQELVEIGISYV